MAVDHSQRNYPQIAVDLLRWYDAHARVLPWRSMPDSPPPDPYRVWLSEIMLQQTTVVAVRPYFESFTRRWPTVEALAAVDDATLMAAWAGLGYYARARNLLACARTVASEHGGIFPDTEAGLRALPGIGAYTAAAIAAIAYGRRAVVVDGNVERVTARLFAVETPLPTAKPALHALTDQITPSIRCGDFAQAMMDLGATICTPRKPKCMACPLQAQCSGRAMAERLPVRLPKADRPTRKAALFWLELNGHVLLVRRPAKGLLGGMLGLPTGPWIETDPGLADAPAPGPWTMAGAVRHVFTHFTLEATLYRLVTNPGDGAAAPAAPDPDMTWWPIETIDAAGLPTLFAKAIALARKEIE